MVSRPTPWARSSSYLSENSDPLHRSGWPEIQLKQAPSSDLVQTTRTNQMTGAITRTMRVGCVALAIGGTTYLVGQALLGMVVVHVVGALLHPVIRLLAA